MSDESRTETRCARCGGTVYADAARCKHCGVAQSEMLGPPTAPAKGPRCPHCGGRVLSTAVSCKHCGRALA